MYKRLNIVLLLGRVLFLTVFCNTGTGGSGTGTLTDCPEVLPLPFPLSSPLYPSDTPSRLSLSCPLSQAV
jgi:hypothetical protein